MDVVNAIEETPTDNESERPLHPIVVSDCGEMEDEYQAPERKRQQSEMYGCMGKPKHGYGSWRMAFWGGDDYGFQETLDVCVQDSLYLGRASLEYRHNPFSITDTQASFNYRLIYLENRQTNHLELQTAKVVEMGYLAHIEKLRQGGKVKFKNRKKRKRPKGSARTTRNTTTSTSTPTNTNTSTNTDESKQESKQESKREESKSTQSMMGSKGGSAGASSAKAAKHSRDAKDPMDSNQILDRILNAKDHFKCQSTNPNMMRTHIEHTHGTSFTAADDERQRASRGALHKEGGMP
eukprot:1392878-Amorphochlora_amoeboformis.AAC.1